MLFAGGLPAVWQFHDRLPAPGKVIALCVSNRLSTPCQAFIDRRWRSFAPVMNGVVNKLSTVEAGVVKSVGRGGGGSSVAVVLSGRFI